MTSAAKQYSTDLLQRRVLRTLMTGQLLSGFGVGVVFSIGALLAEKLSGTPAWSGAAATFSTLGTAFWAFPLARLASNKGRRVALVSGSSIAIIGAILAITAGISGFFPLLLIAFFALGASSAISLQARFAATDLPSIRSAGRDLALVVWGTTIGAVIGPNLFQPGEAIGAFLHLPHLTGPFVITVFAQVAGSTAFLIGLRPDPLLTARSLDASKTGLRPKVSLSVALSILKANPRARFAVITIALSHMVMVGVMSMTTVHMENMGFSLVIVGFTISLHVAGMWGFSPLFGWLTDRFGQLRVAVLAQVVYVVSLLFTSIGDMDRTSLSIGLLLLGLGWSAATVSGSALLTSSVSTDEKPNVQGLSDTLQSLAGAIGGGVSGIILAAVMYSGLSIAAMVPVAIVLVLAALQHGSRTR
jgi:MFS family permease